MRSHAKASTAGSTQRQAKGLGRFFRGADATRAPSPGRKGSSAPSRRLLLCLPLALLLAALFAASAQAVPTTIAGYGEGAGQVRNPKSTAVDQSSGDLYVADRNNFRVSKFDSAGDFLLAWGYGVADGATPELQTCGPEASPPAPRCFKGNNGSQSIQAEDLAVDPSSHDIYAAESRRVTRFTASGEFVFTFGKNVNQTKVGEGATQEEKDFCSASSGDTCVGGATGGLAGEFQNAGALDFDSEGKLWVTDGGSRLQRFEADGSFLEEVSLPSGTQSSALGIDPASGDFYVLGPAGRNESQNVNMASNVSGEYTLTFEGQTTEPLPTVRSPCYSGSCLPEGEEQAETIAVALEALPAIGKGDVIVEPTYQAFVVVFVHHLGGRDVPLLAASGGSPGVTVTFSLNGATGSVRRLEPSGTLIETFEDEPGDIPRALTVDSSGNLYLGDTGRPYHFVKFNSSGEQEAQFGAGNVAEGIFGNGGPGGGALALDESSGSLYAGNNSDDTVKRYAAPEPGPLPENEHVEDLEPTTVTLAADLNPEGHETTYHFEYGTSEGYGSSTPSETLAGEEFDSEAVEAQLEELIPSTTYHFRLVADNECEPSATCTVAGPDTTFTTKPAVAIDAQWASEVAARSAKLNAELNPLGVAGHWWIEYGTSEGYGSETTHEALPASPEDIPVSSTLTGLSANTTYHYRFTASDERDGAPYTVHGADLSFTTGVSGLGFSLPDNRAWEMVTPPQKYGARLRSPSSGQVQAAAGGDGLAYLTRFSIEAYPEGSRAPEDTSALARRVAPGQWASQDISPPNGEIEPIAGDSLEYKLFSSDLAEGLLESRTRTPLSPEASEHTPYLRHDTEPPSYTPLVTGKEGFANVPPGTEFGGEEGRYSEAKIEGASPDLAHVVLNSKVPLAEGVSALNTLYEWTAGRLTPVSVTPEAEGGSAASAFFGSGAASTRKAISDDGSRVFWSTSEGGGPSSPPNGLYVRDLAREETVRLDVVQPGAYGTGAAEPVFQGANAAGTVAFFTDTQNLTEDANESGTDLYRCEVTTAGGELGCELTDLTAQTANAGEAAAVLGGVSGMSDDATRIYFVARGVLDTEANVEGASATAGQPNLYLWRQGAGIRFVTALSGEDFHDWGLLKPGVSYSALELSATASPSGRYLAFMSERPLTGYDNRDAVTGERDQELFRYDAQAGSLLCASCNPTGARPVGVHGLEAAEGGLPRAYDPRGLWSFQLSTPAKPLAATLPEATKIGFSGASVYRTRAMFDNGRVLFNAADSLVPGDSNGNWDVYEYEPTAGTEGALAGDTCTPSSGGAATSRSSGGCVSLLSSGTDAGESAILDASEGGHDVFFLTSGQLSVNDEDHVSDIYDARVDGVAATRVPRSECLGEACQPAPVVPNDKTPASSTFKGQGNLRYRPDCGAIARRTGKLSHRARRLRRHAKHAHNPKARRRTHRQAKRLAHRAHALGVRAERCRRANRRAGR